MTRYLQTVWLVPLGLLLVSAAPAVDPLDLVRAGNAAVQGEDYDTADQLYLQAEEQITDPGLVAFNRAALQYRKHQYASAEYLYRQCLSDAGGRRRALALYGRGNSLVQQAKDLGAPALEDALRCYRASLETRELAPEETEDVLHNLELAKLLWLKMRPSGRESPETPRDPQHDPPRDKPPPRDKKGPGQEDAGQGRTPATTGDQGDAASAMAKEVASAEQKPGASSTVIPDKAELVPLSPDVAVACLKEAGERVQRAAQEHAQGTRLKPAGPLDR